MKIFSSSFLTFLLTLLSLKGISSPDTNSSTTRVLQSLNPVAKKRRLVWAPCVFGHVCDCVYVCVCSLVPKPTRRQTEKGRSFRVSFQQHIKPGEGNPVWPGICSRAPGPYLPLSPWVWVKERFVPGCQPAVLSSPTHSNLQILPKPCKQGKRCAVQERDGFPCAPSGGKG